MLRFTFGTSGAFAACEIMGWYPSFLAPLFAALLLANIPGPLPLKAGIALVIAEGLGAYAAFACTSLLQGTPFVLFILVALVLFVSFAKLANGRALLPILLVLISFATIPVVTLTLPQQSGWLPLAFTRGMAVGVVAVWIAHIAFPAVGRAAPSVPMGAFASPIALAIGGCAVALPLMLLFLLFGVADALPVLITTVVLVINFDPRKGAKQALAMIVGNLVGGLVAVVALSVLQTAPSLAALCLVTVLIGAAFASRVERGGSAGAVALVTYNQAMVMFSLALMPGGADTGLWMTRLFQFAVASLFAIGMMAIVFPRADKLRAAAACHKKDGLPGG